MSAKLSKPAVSSTDSAPVRLTAATVGASLLPSIVTSIPNGVPSAEVMLNVSDKSSPTLSACTVPLVLSIV